MKIFTALVLTLSLGSAALAFDIADVLEANTGTFNGVTAYSDQDCSLLIANYPNYGYGAILKIPPRTYASSSLRDAKIYKNQIVPENADNQMLKYLEFNPDSLKIEKVYVRLKLVHHRRVREWTCLLD